MADVLALYRRAVEEFGARVRAIGDDQWANATPCSDWDVRALVNHLVYEDRWAVPILEGRTMEEVGDRFDGDLLGDDPHGAWTEASLAAADAVARPGVLSSRVHLSFGESSGEEYLSQLTCDHTIHAWDLARGIGADERLDAELVEFAAAYLGPQLDGWRAAGAFGPPVDVPDDADAQTRLLAMTGRRV